MPGPSIKYAIATGHEKTSEVAETVLMSGGNAFDAAVAAYLASFVAEPVMASAGAGGFANIFTANKGNRILDFFCHTPMSAYQHPPSYDEIEVDFGESKELFYTGAASMAVPGAMALISHLAKNDCSIPLRELIQPAQNLAKNGITYTPFQALDTRLLSNVLLQKEAGRKLFLNEGKLIGVGDAFKLPQYADFLESFGKEKPNWFYRGEIAQSIVSFCEEANGYLRYADFENYRVIERKPFAFNYKNKKISTPPLPSMGGGLMHLFLDAIENESFHPLDQHHYLALRNAFAQAIPYTSNTKKLFDKISEKDSTYGANFSGRTPGGTSHLNIVDHQGNAIALSTSIGVGSGYFIEGTDMQMNNMLGEPALMPNGLNSWEKDVRLNSMMCPTLCFDNEENLSMLIGSGGSTRIPFSIAQVLINKFHLNLSTDKAIHLPRVYENQKRIYTEKGYDHHDHPKEKEFSEWPALDLVFGGTHTIDITDKIAVGDERREGSAKLVLTS